MEVAVEGASQWAAIGEVAGIDQLVFERSPKAFDKDVVQAAAAPIHADEHRSVLESRCKVGGRERRALIGIEDLRFAMPPSLFERRQAEGGIERVGQFPTEHETAEPVHDGDQVQEATTHGNI